MSRSKRKMRTIDRFGILEPSSVGAPGSPADSGRHASPGLVGLRPEPGSSYSESATLAASFCHLVAGLSGASPRLRLSNGHVTCVSTTSGPRNPSLGFWRVNFDLTGVSFSTPEGLPGPPRAAPETSRCRGDRWWSVYTSQEAPSSMPVHKSHTPQFLKCQAQSRPLLQGRTRRGADR